MVNVNKNLGKAWQDFKQKIIKNKTHFSENDLEMIKKAFEGITNLRIVLQMLFQISPNWAIPHNDDIPDIISLRSIKTKNVDKPNSPGYNQYGEDQIHDGVTT